MKWTEQTLKLKKKNYEELFQRSWHCFTYFASWKFIDNLYENFAQKWARNEKKIYLKDRFSGLFGFVVALPCETLFSTSVWNRYFAVRSELGWSNGESWWRKAQSKRQNFFVFVLFFLEYGCCDWLEFLISNFMYSGQQLHKFTLFTQFSQLFSTPFQLFSTPFLRSCQREFVRQSRASLGTISLILLTLKLASVYGKETLAARNSDRFKARNVSISHGEQLSRKYIQN